jgi:hypothetical protein
MGREIAERDWKVFKDLHSIAIDRFFEKAVKEMQPLLCAKNNPSQKRFWDALELANRHRKQAAKLFDDFRRSTAIIQAGMIHANKLLTAEEISRFSSEMQAQLRVFSEL